jgi:HAE1 family hydrophobic/amphiphilic exporter-1
MLGIFIFRRMGYKSLPVSDLPTVDFPTITVNANLRCQRRYRPRRWPPLEKNFSTMRGSTP